MVEYRKNSYSDEDMRTVLDHIEGLKAANRSIMAAAMAECAANNAKIKAEKKIAKDDLGIPLKVLNPLLKRRELERKIADITDDVDEEYIEVFEDAAGQFCMFAAVDAEDGDENPEPAEPDEPVFDDDAEQAAGAEALSQVKH